jgi:Flp pilus assembly protein TadG
VTTHARREAQGERGAIIVQAAIAMLVLVGFSGFVVDYGVLWLSRQQAQDAADAGAMAGAMSRAYDDSDDPPSAGGVVEQSAAGVTAANLVWFQSPAAVVTFTCPADVSGGRCVRVDVHRDGTFGSTPLPVIFGGALGLSSQEVRATATAQVAVGNSTTCLKPWAIPDKWDELNPAPGPWLPTSVFEAYDESGPGAGTLLVPADSYVPPDESGVGTGLALGSELGLPMTLSFVNPNGSSPISPGFLLPLLLAGGNSYAENISGCNGRLTAIGQYISTGNNGLQSDTTDGFSALMAADPAATWNSATNTVEGSCAPTCASISPRLVAIAVFDVERYQFMRANNDWSACPGGGRCVQVVNIIGFFLDGTGGPGEATGYVARHPGLVSPDSPSLSVASSFVPAITLVR